VAATNPVSAVATGTGVGIAMASAQGNAIGTIVAGGGGMLLLGVG
jgi:hypothetical protein